MQPDGTGRTEVLTTAGEITDFAFAPDGTIWMTTLESEGGRLYRVNSDQWGVTVELTVSQIDGRALSCPTQWLPHRTRGLLHRPCRRPRPARCGERLRTELTAHTGTGSVYVYDPAARTVETVLTGIAGASGLALDEAAETLYVSDLGNRCVWAVDTAPVTGRPGAKAARPICTACPATPVPWRWMRTAHSTSATAGPGPAGWKTTPGALCCGAWPCG